LSMFFFSSRRRHTRFSRDWSSDVCSSDLSGRWKRMRMEIRRYISVLCVVGAVLSGARPGAAQQPPADSTVALDSLMVTVLRTPTRVVEAPFSVDALRRDAAERARPSLGLDEAFR